MRNKEYDLSKAIATYLQLQYPAVIYHFDMGGLNLSMRQATMLKAIQKRKGFPDLFIMEARGFEHGLFIELKIEGYNLKKRNGEWVNDHIKEQAEYLDNLFVRGYAAHFACGFNEAKFLIDQYLKQ